MIRGKDCGRASVAGIGLAGKRELACKGRIVQPFQGAPRLVCALVDVDSFARTAGPAESARPLNQATPSHIRRTFARQNPVRSPHPRTSILRVLASPRPALRRQSSSSRRRNARSLVSRNNLDSTTSSIHQPDCQLPASNLSRFSHRTCTAPTPQQPAAHRRSSPRSDDVPKLPHDHSSSPNRTTPISGARTARSLAVVVGRTLELGADRIGVTIVRRWRTGLPLGCFLLSPRVAGEL